MKKFWYLNLVLILSSCTTDPYSKLVSATDNSKIVTLSKNMKNKCLNENHPQFLTSLYSKKSHIDFQLEGVWQKNFYILNMQVLGKFGEQYVNITLNKHKIEKLTIKSVISNNHEIKEFINFISAIGSENLRSIFCGTYAFNPNYMFLQNPDITSNSFYITRNHIDLNSHSIDIDTNLQMTNEPKIFNLILKSKFIYEFLGKNTLFEIEWSGAAENKRTIPKNIIFSYDANSYHLNILDFS